MNTEEILAKLNPRTQQSIRRASDIQIVRQKLPSIALTKALSGGLVYGTQTMVWGNRSAGKSAFCLQTIGMAQDDGRSCALVDAERAFDPNWAQRLGVDTTSNNQLVVTPIASLSDATDAVADLVKGGIDLIVVDSISALLPDSFYNDKGELKDISETGQIGRFSKGMGDFSKMINSLNEHTQIMLISQIRNEFSKYGAKLAPMGGRGVDHHNSTSIKLWASTAAGDQIQGNIQDGDIVLTEPVGRKVTWTLDKARGKGMGQTHHYNLFYNGPFVGIDTAGELVDIAVAYGKVRKSGNWYYIYDEKFNGAANAAEYIRNNDGVRAKLEGELLA